MKYRVDKDYINDFDMMILEHIKDSIPYTEEDNYLIFDEDTGTKINDFREACDGSIREVIWNEDNAEYFRDHRESFIEALQESAEDIMCDEEHPSAVSFVGSFNCFREDDITYDDIAKGLFDPTLKPDIHSWEFQVQSMCTIWAVERLMFDLQNNIEEIEEDEEDEI